MITMFLAMLESEEDREKFLKLHSAYETKMMRIAVSILKSRTAAEDAVQQSWVQVIQHFDEIRQNPWDRIEGYMAVVVKNIAVTLLRQNRRTDTLPENWDVPVSEQKAFGTPDGVIAIIRAMPELYRQVLEMKFVLEYSNREIAKVLRMNEATVATRVSRGRKALTAKLAEAGYGYDE